MLLIIAIVGTTVAPWQLFFQQSNIIDKRITPRWINYERLDTWIGAFVVVLGAAALIAISAFAFRGTPLLRPLHRRRRHGRRASSTSLGSVAGGFFAVVLLNASLIGAGRADAVDELRLRRHVRHQELAASQLQRRARASTRSSPA